MRLSSVSKRGLPIGGLRSHLGWWLPNGGPGVRCCAGVMIQEPLSMAPDLIFDEVRGAIKAGIGFLRLGIRLQRRAGTQMQGAIGPESRPLRFNRDMTSDQPGPVFRQCGIDSRFYMRAKSQAYVQILSRDTQSHSLLSAAGGACRCSRRRCGQRIVFPTAGRSGRVSGLELSLLPLSKGRGE